MLKIGAIVDGIRTRKDNTLAITIGTQEPTEEQAAAAIALRNKYITLICAGENESEYQESESTSSIPNLFNGGRSQSQRFRAVLYRVWEQSGSQLDAETFYNVEMEKLIEHYKKKLN